MNTITPADHFGDVGWLRVRVGSGKGRTSFPNMVERCCPICWWSLRPRDLTQHVVVSTDIAGNWVFYQMAMVRNHEIKILTLSLHLASWPSSWLWPTLKGLVKVSCTCLLVPPYVFLWWGKRNGMAPHGSCRTRVLQQRRGDINMIIFLLMCSSPIIVNIYWLLLLKNKWVCVVIMHSTGTNHCVQKQTSREQTWPE